MSGPYTYLLTHKISGQRYYGARYARGCHPNDLWTTYFSSSKRVSWLVEKYGKDSFDYEIRRTFTDADSCREWECKFLQRVNAKQSKEWLNANDRLAPPVMDGANNRWFQTDGWRKGKTNSVEHRARISQSCKGRVSPTKGKPRSDETRARISASNKGRVSPMKGRRLTIEHKAKIAASERGKQVSIETREKIMLANERRHSKQWIITIPNGEIVSHNNLERFCRENKLHVAAMRKVARGIYKQHKGYRVCPAQ